MSETMKFVALTQCFTLEDLDIALKKLDDNGIDCYPEGGSIYINPEQWDKAVQVMIAGPRRSAVLSR